MPARLSRVGRAAGPVLLPAAQDLGQLLGGEVEEGGLLGHPLAGRGVRADQVDALADQRGPPAHDLVPHPDQVVPHVAGHPVVVPARARHPLLVHQERVPGSRRDYYRMPGNMWDDMIRMRDQVMGRWTALVREGIDLVGADTPAGERMAEQAAFLDFATKELSQILSRWQEYRASGAADPR